MLYIMQSSRSHNMINLQVSVQRYRLSCLAIRPFDLCAFKIFLLNIWTYECTKCIKNCRGFHGERKNHKIAPGLGTTTINHIENKQKNGKS